MKVVLIFCRGRSGSYYLHSLLDGHSQILSMPPASSIRRFFHATDKYWHDGGAPKLNKAEMVEAFINENPAIFDARGKSRGLGFDKMGANRDGYTQCDVETFRRELALALPADLAAPTRKIFFGAVHQAYQRALRPASTGREKWIVYQLHNPIDERGIRETMIDFPDASAIGVSSDPIRSFVSFLFLKEPELMAHRARVGEFVRTATFLYCYRMLIEGWDTFRSRYPSTPFRVQSLLSLHKAPETVMRQLATWLGIYWEPRLLASTFNDLIWNGDRWSIFTSGPSATDPDLPLKRADAVLSRVDRRILTTLLRKTAKESGANPGETYGRIRAAIYLALPTRMERTAIAYLAGVHR